MSSSERGVLSESEISMSDSNTVSGLSGRKSVWYSSLIASLQFLMFLSCMIEITSLTAAVLKSGKSDFSHHRTGSSPAAMYSGREGINITLTDV